MLAYVGDNRLECFLTRVGLFLRDCLYVARYGRWPSVAA
jgi:hypothetical protein